MRGTSRDGYVKEPSSSPLTPGIRLCSWGKVIVLAGLMLPVSLLGTMAEFFVATALESSRGGSAISLTDQARSGK
jgi:hypothetical protein